ncbi:S24 family peptidase, partial [Salmonella enterica]|uniref:S24 family peptidase n=1 Tax=Salmonella enterica TaxID=28901 RepID=UPI003CED1613
NLPLNYTPVIEHDPDNDEFAEIRKVKLRLSAGITGFDAIPDIEDGRPITFRKEWLIRKGYAAEKLIVIGVKGESMEPTMSGGDTVVIN